MTARHYCILLSIIVIMILSSSAPVHTSNGFNSGTAESPISSVGLRDFDSASTDYSQISVKSGKETAYYGMADDISVRELEGYADYLICSHALYGGGADIVDNVRYLHDHGTKIILVVGWWDVWPFPGVVDGWEDMHKEDVVYGMNATETVKYRIRGCLDTIGVEYVHGVIIGEEQGPRNAFPGEFVAWYLNLFYDWLHDEYPDLLAYQWPAPYTWILEPSCKVKADGIVVDDYSQHLDVIETEARLIKDSYPESELLFIVSAVENFGWFTCHTPTYLKQAVDTVLEYAETVGFWVTDGDWNEGWEVDNWMYNVSLDMCDQIHAHSFNTILADTAWFPDEFGNDTVTDSTSDWYSSNWRDVAPDSSLIISTASDRIMGDASVNLTRTTTGEKSFWWQPLTHDYGLPDYPTAGAWGVFNLSCASRVKYFVKGVGWGDKTDIAAHISIEKYNSYFADGNVTLPDISDLLTDGQWHEVVIDLPLPPEYYYEWDGYASQLRVVTDYSSGSTPCSILFDGWEIQALDAGKVMNLTTTDDYTYVENGTLYVMGDAYVERNMSEVSGWYYKMSGTGQVSMRINGTWTIAPEPGTPVYDNLTGFRLYGGAFDYIQINSVPPLVSIDTHSSGEIVAGQVSVGVTAIDPSGIDDVIFYLDGIAKHTDNEPPFAWDWDTTQYADGSHLLNITATSGDGTLNYDYCYLTVDNTAPTLSVDSPSNHSAHHGVVDVNVDATDSSGMNRVEFWLNGALLESDPSTPYSLSINSSMYEDGDYHILIHAYDVVENREIIDLHIVFDNSAPQISLVSIEKTLYDVTVSVNATDRYGIERVEFYIDGVLEAVYYSPPYICTFTSLTDGNHTVIATAFSNSGLSTNTTASFRWDTFPPEVISLSITQTYDNVTISVDAFDLYGVDHVDFSLDGSLVLSDFVAPYECVLTGLTEGTHTVSVVVHSTSGLTSSSAATFLWDTLPPAVIIHSFVQTLHNVTVAVNVTDNYAINRVEFWLDGTQIHVDYSEPFSHTVGGFTEGEHTINVIAFSSSGFNSSTSVTFHWFILDPTISIASINTTVYDMFLVANAFDAYGISHVDFFLDGQLVVSDSLYPFECVLTNLAEGAHAITVTVSSITGRTASTATSFVWDIAPPLVTIHSFTQTEYNCSLIVNVTDSYGVERVEFWLDGVLAFTDSISPYSYVASDLSDGNHMMTVWAFSTSNLNSSVTVAFLWTIDSPRVTIENRAVTPFNATFDVTVIDHYGVDFVEFWLDGVCLWNHSESSFTYILSILEEGNHTISVSAFSISGKETTVTSHFYWHMKEPLITIESLVMYTDNITVIANATDAYGVDFVEFWLDGVLVYIDYSFPYEYSMMDVAVGTHNVSATVYSVSGYSSSTTTSFVWDVTRPQVSIVSMTSTRQNVTIVSSAVDVYGIERVEFWLDGACLWNHSEGVYSYVLEGLSEGNHTVRIVAFSVTSKNASVISSFEWLVYPPEVYHLSVEQTLSQLIVEVDAEDPYGIQYVEFWIDEFLEITVYSKPYICVIDGLAQGDHVVRAIVHSISGKNGTAEATIAWVMLEPQISLTSVVENPSGVWVSVDVSDRFGVDRVEFFIDGSLATTLYTPDFQWWFTGLAEGNHTITVIAYNIYGLNSTLEIEIDWDSLPPNLSLASTLPVTLSGLHEIELLVSDPSGVFLVEVIIDGVIRASMYSGPYSWILDTALWSDGNHSILIRAVDNRGNVQILVFNVVFDNSAPSIILLEPHDDSQIEGPTDLLFVVSVTDLSLVDKVYLNYSLNSNEWILLKMFQGLQGYSVYLEVELGTTLAFRIFCNDSLDNSAMTDIYTVQVSDTTDPEVSIISWLPEAPFDGDAVTVRISTQDAGGIATITLFYRVNGESWVEVVAREISGGWSVSIPGLVNGSLVEFHAEALDLSGNRANSMSYSYIVGAAPSGTTTPPTTPVVPDPLSGPIMVMSVGGIGIVIVVVVLWVKKRRGH